MYVFIFFSSHVKWSYSTFDSCSKTNRHSKRSA